MSKKTRLLRWKKGQWSPIAIEDFFEKYEGDISTSGREFTVSVKIPKGKYELYLVAKANGLSSEYPLQFEANESWPEAPPPALNRYLCRDCFDFGLGFNYLSLSHSNVAPLAAVNYAAIALPAAQFQYRKKLSRISGVRLSYWYNKGADFSPKAITLKEKAVALNTLSFGYEKISTPNGTLLGADYSKGLTYFLNGYAFPMARSIGGSSSEFTIQTFNVYSAGIGGFFGLQIGESEFITQLNVQLPLAATNVKLNGGLSFDGSLTYLTGSSKVEQRGGNSKVKTGSYWGFRWGGQYHSYQYALTDQTLTDGSYSVFLSKMEAFWGYSF